MIGLHLPRGTKIICTFQPSESYVRAINPRWVGKLLTVGAVYTLRGYEDCSVDGDSDPGVLVEEVRFPHSKGEYCYALEDFDVVQTLPASILECLNVKAPAKKRKRESA